MSLMHNQKHNGSVFAMLSIHLCSLISERQDLLAESPRSLYSTNRQFSLKIKNSDLGRCVDEAGCQPLKNTGYSSLSILFCPCVLRK